MQVFRALDHIRDLDSRNNQVAAQVDQAKEQLARAVQEMPRQISAQASQVALNGSIDITPLQRAMAQANQVFEQYRMPSGNMLRSAQRGSDALRDLDARTRQGPIIAGVMKPVADDKQLGQ